MSKMVPFIVSGLQGSVKTAFLVQITVTIVAIYEEQIGKDVGSKH